MNTYFLSHHVHVACLDDGLVFLDLRTQRYLGLDSAEAHRLRTLVPGWPSQSLTENSGSHTAVSQDAPATHDEETRAAAHELVARNILTTDPTKGREAAPVSLRISQAIPFEGRDAADRLGARHVCEFLIACARAAFNLRTHSIEHIIRKLEARNAERRRWPQPEVREILRLVRVFRRLRPFLFTARGACLFDSLALVVFLGRYRVSATLVLGVSNKPFGAHAWAQWGDLVLNDTLESVKHHVPILAV